MPKNPVFETFLKHLEVGNSRSRKFRDALIEVGDTMEGCRAWFEQHCGPEVTAMPADLVMMAALVLQQAREGETNNETYAQGLHDAYESGFHDGRKASLPSCPCMDSECWKESGRAYTGCCAKE